MNKFGTIVQADWHNTSEGEAVLQRFYNGERKLFGILERPFDNIDEVSYKVVLIGKSGVGKTLTVSRLAGLLNSSYVETLGIRITNIYWPVKIWEKIILFKLQFWDTGHNGAKKYSHIPASFLDKADLKVFVFSYNDINSFLELNQLITPQEDTNQPATLSIGTRLSSKVKVNKSQVCELENNFKTKVFSLSLTQNQTGSTKVAPILNAICELLWIRDQQYIINSSSS